MRMRIAWIVCATAGIVTGAYGRERPKGPDQFAIENARIVLGTGEVVEAGTIVIDNGLIQDVGSSVTIPAAAWVIDGSGMVVYPGLIDALSDIALAKPSGDGPAPEYSTGPEDRPGTEPWRSAADELDTSDARIGSWRDAGFTSAVTSPTEGIVSGQAAMVNLAGDSDNAMVVADRAALRVNLSPLNGRRGYPGSMMGVMAYVKQLFFDASHYRESWAAYRLSPKGRPRPSYDRALRPLADVQSERSPVLLPAHLEHEVKRAVKLARELEIRPVLYGLHQGHAAADFLAAENVPVLVSVKWPERSKDADPDADEPLSVLRLRDRAPGTPAALEAAGVEFAFYSDGHTKPEDILKAVRTAIDQGLSPERALRAWTLAPAIIFGLDDRMGSITPGKIANLVVASGELFDSETRVEMVFVDGQKYEPAPPSGDERRSAP